MNVASCQLLVSLTRFTLTSGTHSGRLGSIGTPTQQTRRQQYNRGQ